MALYNIISNGGGEDPEKKETKRLLGKTMKYDNKRAIDVISSVAKKTGLSPSFIGASAFQEGMNEAVYSPNTRSEAYFNAGINESEWPVDGFYAYGLDTFGQMADTLKKKGYLPKEVQYKTYKAKNEKNQDITTAAFKTNEDALTAKAAYMKYFQDNVKDYASKKKLSLSPDQLEYITMAGYNAGLGNTNKLLDEMAAANNPNYLKEREAKGGWLKKNIEPRTKKKQWIDEFIKEDAVKRFGSGSLPAGAMF